MPVVTYPDCECCEGHALPCCTGQTLPDTLNAAFIPLFGGCPCAAGAGFPIVWNPAHTRWEGTGTVCGQLAEIWLATDPTFCFRQGGSFCGQPLDNPGVFSYQCPPTFRFRQNWGVTTTCCIGAFTIEITE